MSEVAPRVSSLTIVGSGVGFDDGRKNGRICRAKGHTYERERYNMDTNQNYMEVGEDGTCLLCGIPRAELIVDNENLGS